jgi:hypothetical protein
LRRYYSPIVVFTILLFSGLCIAQTPWSGVLNSNRAIDWSFAGIPNGIPSSSWTQCGATISPGASASTIVNALNHTGSGYTSCGANTYIQLAAGTFNLSSAIDCKGCNNTELRGMGADQTHLVFSAGSTCQGGNGQCLVGFESSDSTYPNGPPSNIYNWTSGYSKGSTSITLSSGASIKANSTILVLDQCDTGYSGAPCSGSAVDNGNFFNCGDAYNPGSHTGCSVNNPDGGAARSHRFQWEMVEATACSPSCGGSGATTVTITPPLQHPNWTSGQNPQIWLIQPSRFVGIRNLSIDGSATSTSAAVSFYNDAYVWATGVAVFHPYSMGIYVDQTIHAQIESNYVFDAGHDSDASDPSGINYTGSNNLIDNNIVQKAHVEIIGNGPDNGNVVAYNYLINAYGGDDFLFGGLWDGHSNGVDYNLFEGNVVNQVFEDQIHGSHLMETFYRNFLTGWESCSNGNCGSNTQKDSSVATADVLSYNRYGNWVGNVMGTPGIETSAYQSATNEYDLGGAAGDIWILGSGNQSVGIGGPIPLDSVVGTTVMRWGNWDAFNNATRWNTSEVPSGISVYPNAVPTSSCTSSASCPPSFFLTARPAWWSSSIPFPAIGPDVTGGNIGQCSGTKNASGSFAGVAATSSANCASTSLSSAWAGHINAIPAMSCFLNVMNGPPDGSGNALTFNANACYGGGSTSSTPPTPPPAPTGLSATVN